MKISILNGSVYGKAMEMADVAEEFLQSKNFEVEVLEELKAADLGDKSTILVITSTTGSGEIPANIFPSFIDWKQDKPNLANKVYGVIGLGDSTYGETFCAAALMFDGLLAQLGAKQVSNTLKLDNSQSPDYEKEVIKWLSEFIDNL